MSALFGGLGIVSVRTPVADWDWNKLPGEGEIRSLLFAFLFLVVFVVLAHLTNPSETSFRTFLTEQSFRQHLSRLDQSSEDATDADDYALPHTHKGLGFERPVHFANRASVSLRTPKHITHSFGILTVAAVVPDAHTRTSRADCAACTDDFEGASNAITDSWFVGAFGKWWRGGALDAWWLETMSKSKSEEGWTSGILGIKSLDRIASATGLSLSSYYSNRLFSRITPTSIRQPRGASSPQFPGSLRQRSLSPPPLPKSASLPLHTAPNLRSTSQQQVQTLTVPAATACDPIRGSTPALSRTSSTMCLDPSSPMISELLRQIGISKTTVEDLRNQLADLQQAAAESHAGLQSELDEHRERRRQEEAARAELRARTKTIEDQRRAADAAKRDAEKRLKAAHTQRDHAAQRMAHLDKEIAKLRQRAAGDAAARRAGAEEAAVAEKEHAEQLAQKRKEIGIAEDVVAALNARARQLEEKIGAEKERLRRAREQAEARSLEQQATILNHGVLTGEPASWGSLTVEPDHDRASSSPEGTDSSMSPRPKHLSLGSVSNFSHSEPAENNQIALRAKGYSIFNDDLASLQHQQRSAVGVPFTPYGERDSDSSGPPSDPPITPLSSSLIPTSLIKSLDASEQFVRSDDDPIVGRETEVALRYPPLPPAPFELPHHASSLPIVLPGPDADDYDPFEVRPPPPRERADCFDTQRATFHRHAPEVLQTMYAEEEPVAADKGTAAPRRWFSSSTSSTKDKEKPKRGLNPDAKVFSLARKKAPTVPLPRHPPPASSVSGGSALGNLHYASASLDTFDRLNPSIPASTSTPAPAGHSLWSTISMRAFAPSPAEREALQRALGGSTNTSLDRLPTLSDVPGSLPATPPHAHAVAFPGPGPALDLGAFGLSAQPQRSSWLSNFGFMGSRKPKFSPWDDEETVVEKEEGGEKEKKLVVMEQ